jgi:hypothetical protein
MVSTALMILLMTIGRRKRPTNGSPRPGTLIVGRGNGRSRLVVVEDANDKVLLTEPDCSALVAMLTAVIESLDTTLWVGPLGLKLNEVAEDLLGKLLNETDAALLNLLTRARLEATWDALFEATDAALARLEATWEALFEATDAALARLEATWEALFEATDAALARLEATWDALLNSLTRALLEATDAALARLEAALD